MAMLAAPLKKSEAVDFTKPLKNFIKNTYTNVPEDFKPDTQISELNKLRTNAVVRTLDRHDNSLEVLYRFVIFIHI